MSEQVPRKRLGEILVMRGVLREGQVERVLSLQAERRAVGVRARFGEVCVGRGWVSALAVRLALAEQASWTLEHLGTKDALLELDFVSREALERFSGADPAGDEEAREMLLAHGLCTPEALLAAERLSLERRAQAIRARTGSSFSPLNVMELLVDEEVSRALPAEGGCSCTQCWANVIALALNNLPPRYVTEMMQLGAQLQRSRVDYGALVAERVSQALGRVRANPKVSCLARFSDEILASREAESEVHEVTVRVSARHVHLSADVLPHLFGAGYELKKLRGLVQPGQYAAEAVVSLVGPKGRIERVRVLGPLRKRTQVELSGTDQFVLGIQAPVRESGRLDGTPGIRVEGPAGVVLLRDGVIRALRHVHMPPRDAERLGVHNGSRVAVRLAGDRPTILEEVLVRATESSALEMHIDTDEANAAGVPAESQAHILLPR